VLRGKDLFLVDSVSVDANFVHATRVPDGFTASMLRIAHPLQGRLYVKLRDDPGVVNVAVLDVKSAPSASAAGVAPPSPPEQLPEPTPQLAVTADQSPMRAR